MPRALVERFEQLEQANAARSEWVKFSLVVLETLVKHQSAVMELHREMLSRASDLRTDECDGLRTRARDGLTLVNQLATLHQLVQSKIRTEP